jgi:hypothetical protein
MNTLLIVKAQIVLQLFPCLMGTGVIFQIDLLVFNCTSHSFSKDIIERTAFAIHADAHIVGQQQLRILRAGKLAALVAIANLPCNIIDRGFLIASAQYQFSSSIQNTVCTLLSL